MIVRHPDQKTHLGNASGPGVQRSLEKQTREQLEGHEEPDDENGSRGRQLADASAAREASGRDPIAIASFVHDGHNLMRYRPREVAAAILSVAG